MYKLHLPNNLDMRSIEKELELQTIEALEAEMDKEVDRMKRKAYSRRLTNMYEDMWTNGATGLR